MKALKIILIASTCYVLIFTPLFLLLNHFFFSLEFSRQGIESQSGINRENYLLYTGQVIKYFFNTEKEISIKGADGNIINNFFTEEEIIHMRDVKRIIRIVFYVLIISLILTVFVLTRTKGKYGIISVSSTITFIIISVVAIFAYFGFDRSFYIFHEVLFRNQYWLLPADTMLIKMFPLGFFYEYAIVWFIMSACLSLFTGIIARNLRQFEL